MIKDRQCIVSNKIDLPKFLLIAVSRSEFRIVVFRQYLRVGNVIFLTSSCLYFNRWLTRRHRSYLLISFLWVVPLVFIFAPVGEWNCVKTCQCLSECFPFNHGYKPSDYSCSRIFPPMANSWLSLVVLSWIIEILATLWLLKRSVQKITNTWVQASSLKCEKQRADGSYKTADLNSIRDGVSPGNLSQLSEECKFAKSNGLNLDCSCSENSLCSDIGVDKFVNKNDLNIKKCREENFENEDNKGISSEQKFCEASNSEIRQTFTKITEEPTKITMKCKETTTHRRMMKHLRNTRTSTFNLRFVIWLTVSFILCTTPTMVLLAIDILTPNLKLNMIVLNLCLMCPFVYCYTCPYILVKCLPGVKKSLSALVLSIYSTTD